MGKIHTHYDNLKVARLAPQEVIRAAYKALSQKYHPDKNPGDEKASRIMAILNSAYGTLSDPQRRKEHDEWIAAEEWEIEWLESTRNEDSRNDKSRHEPHHASNGDHVSEPAAPRRRRRDWKWWGAMVACLGLGWTGGVTMVAEPQMVSALLASAWGGRGAPDARTRPDSFKLRPEARSKGDEGEAAQDGWAVGRPYYPETSAPKPPPIKVVTLSQIMLPAAAVDCDSEAQTLVAPNGEAWPARSGYVEGFPIGNKGEDMQLTLDNAGNASAVFIKLYDMERRSNVRYVFVQAHDRLVVDRLTSGKYEVRYQNIDLGANQAGCTRHKTGRAAGTAPAPAISADASASPLN